MSSIWHSLCLCSESLEPITPVYNWEYTPAAAFSSGMRKDAALSDALYRSTGCMPNAVVHHPGDHQVLRHEDLVVLELDADHGHPG